MQPAAVARRAATDSDRTAKLTWPVAASWAATLLLAATLAAAVYRLPIQVSDSLEQIQNAHATPTVRQVFVDALRSSDTMLRPLRQVQTKVLLNGADAMGWPYHVTLRGYHAATAALLVILFAFVVRPRTWADAAAFAFALTVLSGLHTFAGMMREAYPINHFLLIGIYCLATYALAQSRGGVLADLAALLLFTLASLTLESGLLVWVIAVAGYIAGLRGLSLRALAGMTLLVAGYLVLREGYLQMASAALGDRPTGYGTEFLYKDALVEKFGANPLHLYAYTVVSSVLTVLLSQPSMGVWTAAAAWQAGQFMPVYTIEIGTSLAATALCAWYLLGRGTSGRRRWREPAGFVMLAALAASALVSYAYAKDEIVSAAALLYVVIVFRAAAELLTRLAARPFGWRVGVAAAAILVVSSAWAFRSMGLHYRLMHGAWDARSEWALRTPPVEPWESPGRDPAIAERLRDEELRRGGLNPHMLPDWAQRYWGED